MSQKLFSLKEDHPFMKKVNELCEIMDKLGITIDLTYDGLLMIDKTKGDRFKIRDMDSMEPCQDFPPPFEFKLTFYKEVED